MRPVYLSIIIPAYNEEINIRLGALDKVARYLERQSWGWEVIVINDGSADATQLLIQTFIKDNPGFRLINNPHQGKAASVVTGIFAAKGNNVLFSDLDQATPISEVEKLIYWIRKGYDIVIGSRNSKREGAPLLRLVMARGFMMLRSVCLGLHGISDTQCGFKSLRREVAMKILNRLKLYGSMHEVSGSMVSAGFDIELLYIAKSLGYKIKEVPVEWHYVETRRVNPVKDSWQGFMDILNIRVNAMRGFYR